MVRRGLGVTVATSSSMAGVDMRGLALVPIPESEREVGIMTLADARPSPAAQAFMRCIEGIQPAC